MNFQENSLLLLETSSPGPSFNNLNKTFDLNKCDEHLKSSDGIKKKLEPFNKLTFDHKNQIKYASRHLSEMESDESLGILPDLLKDEITFDLFQTELDLPDNEVHEVIESEISDNATSLVFSPPCDSQFNKISLFLKNVSTPLPNFVNNRRCSSTPKILDASPFVANEMNTDQDLSPRFLYDKEEEPIIAGSCRIKFETDFNLDDLKTMKPLTSTYKAFAFPPVSPIVSAVKEPNEKTDLKCNVTFQEQLGKIEKNLNATQVFSNSEDLFPLEQEDSIKNENILNDTFKIGPSALIKSNDAVALLKPSIPSTRKISQIQSNNSTENVKVLDSTFAIATNQIDFVVNCEKTFVFDFNSPISAEETSKPMYKEAVLNETCVLETDSTVLLLKQQEKITNTTFTKEVEDDTQIILENPWQTFNGADFTPIKKLVEETLSANEIKPMTPILEETFLESEIKPKKQILDETFSGSEIKSRKPILEETFSEKDLNEMKVCSKNVSPCINRKSQSSSPETFKINLNFSEEVDKALPSKKITQNNYAIKFTSSNFFETSSTLPEEAEEKNCFYEQINLAENLNELPKRMSFSDAIQPIKDTSIEKSLESVDKKIDKDDSVETRPESVKLLASTTFDKEMEGQLHPLQSNSDAISSEKMNEKSDKVSSTIQDNFSELASFLLPKASSSFTIPDGSDEANILESSILKHSNSLIQKGNPNCETISSGMTDYSSDINKFDNCHAVTSFSEVTEDSIFVKNTPEETEICNSVPAEDCSLEILSKSSNNCLDVSLVEKNNQFQNNANLISSENEFQASETSFKEMPSGILSQKIGEVQIEPNLIPTEKDVFCSSPDSQKEITSAYFSYHKDNKIPDKLHLNQCKRDSVDETSLNTANSQLRDSLSKKAIDKDNSSLKSCSLEAKGSVKSGLIKPTRIVYPRMVSEQRVGPLPTIKSVCKSIIDKRHVPVDLNRTLNLSHNSTQISFSKDINRRFSLSCSPKGTVNASKYKNDFKKPFEIPSKLGIKKPVSNFQKSRLDIKYSNGPLKNITAINDKQNFSQPDFLSDKGAKSVKSTASSYGKGCTIVSRLNHVEKLSTKTSINITDKKNTNNCTGSSKIMDMPKEEKFAEIERNNANLEKNSRHSIVTNLPKTLTASLNKIPIKTCISKPAVINQKSGPTSYKFDSLRAADTGKLSKCITKPKFSLLPKVPAPLKMSSDSSKHKDVVEKRLITGNKKSIGFLKKPCVSEAVQLVKTQTSTVQRLPKGLRENTQLKSPASPTTSEQAVQSSIPKVYRQNSRKLPQLRKIPGPCYNK